MNIVSLTFKCISIFLHFCVRCCIFFCILSFISSQFSLFIFCKNNCRDKKRKLFFFSQWYDSIFYYFCLNLSLLLLFCFLPHLKHFGRIYFFRKYTNVMSIQNKLSPDLFVVVFKIRYCIYFYYCLKMVYLYSVFILYRQICHVVADCSRLLLSLSNCYTEAVVGCTKLIYFSDILKDSIFYI